MLADLSGADIVTCRRLPLFTLGTYWCFSWVGCFSSSQFKQVVTWKQFEQIFLLKVLAQGQHQFCIQSIKLGMFLLLCWCSNYLPYTQDQPALKYHQSHQRLTQNLIPQILLKLYYTSYQKDCQYTNQMDAWCWGEFITVRRQTQ